jgi:EAL domain-containing protein (putative c-di-GMP-specific phosphodiesterase class I)
MQVAESSGLIVEIGEWVLAEACQQAATWREAGNPVPVSVNVSAFQLARSDLADSVGRALDRSGLDPHLLELEVTESTLLADEGAAMRQLHRLKALGVRLVVDNFGTGYSSLPALRDLMIDGLKLDRSFVSELERDADDGALIDAVLSLAAALDAEVTAEGVETWAQVSRLRMHGCDFAQGYLFARPAPAGVMTERLAREFQRAALAS